MYPTRKDVAQGIGLQDTWLQEKAEEYFLGDPDIRRLDTDSEFKYTMVQAAESDYSIWVPLGRSAKAAYRTLYEMAPEFVRTAAEGYMTDEQFGQAAAKYFEENLEFLGWEDEFDDEEEDQIAEQLGIELKSLNLATNTRPYISYRH